MKNPAMTKIKYMLDRGYPVSKDEILYLLDSAVDSWHEDEDEHLGTLSSYLGLTTQEYAEFVLNPDDFADNILSMY